jgi:SAM-dependent methyltransferase
MPLMHAAYYDREYFDGSGKSNYTSYSYDSSPFADHADAVIRFMNWHRLAGPVLDIGCAKGYLVYLLRQRGVEAFGVDWSQYAIGTASPDVVPFLREASAYDLPYPDRHFALAVSFDVLEHLDGSHARRALVESARVSHRQLHQINTGRLDEWAFDGDPSHCTKLTLAQWQATAANANLTGATICEPDRRLPFLEGIVQ